MNKYSEVLRITDPSSRLSRKAVKEQKQANMQPTFSPVSVPFAVLSLQHSYGNHFVQKLVARSPQDKTHPEFAHILQQQKDGSILQKTNGARSAITRGPELKLTGQATAAAVAQILPTAHSIVVPSNLGDVELRPGAIWSDNKMLVYAAPLYVWYTVGDRFYEWSTSLFIRDEWLTALGQGAARAMGMVYLAKIEMAFLQGLFVPWYILLGVSVAKAGLFYHNHKQQVDMAWQKTPAMIRLLNEFKTRYPTLFDKLLMSAARDLLFDLPSGVTGEDVAFFLGRVFKGVGGLPEITLGAVVHIIAKVAAIVTATHLPSMAAHVIAKAAQRSANTLKASLAEAGILVSEEEANIILRELLSRRDTVQKLEEVRQTSEQLIPILNQLTAAWRSSN